jgi:hypothetical protein
MAEKVVELGPEASLKKPSTHTICMLSFILRTIHMTANPGVTISGFWNLFR